MTKEKCEYFRYAIWFEEGQPKCASPISPNDTIYDAIIEADSCETEEIYICDLSLEIAGEKVFESLLILNQAASSDSVIRYMLDDLVVSGFRAGIEFAQNRKTIKVYSQ